MTATIIGLLATIGITSYNSLSKQSRDAKRKGDLQNIRSALEFYRSDNDYYPAALATLVPSSYLKSVPDDPKATPQSYVYCPTPGSGNRTNYDLCAYTESEAAGTLCGCGSCGTNGCNYKLTPLGEE